MLKTLRLSFALKNTYRVNSILYAVKQMPFLGRVIPGTVYQIRGFKIFANVISVIWEIVSAFLGKYLYFLLLIGGALSLYGLPGEEAGQAFLHVLVFLSLAGMVLNTYMFNPTKDKYYAMILLGMDARGYTLVNFFYAVLKVLAGFALCALLFGLPLGCALELVHTYSLIHDDLPCMDDDDLRRGRPTCHKVYGETMAVLAGDALQGEAFRVIASAGGLTGEQRSDAVLALARACGADGMVAGQVLDMDKLAGDEASARQLCALKTGALLRAAAALGAIAAGASAMERAQAEAFASHVGLAFQVRDDMLDVTADQAELGKPVGSDRAEGKRTFVDLLGLGGCGALVAEETRLAKEAVSAFRHSGFLLALADSLADRRK